MMTQSKNSSLNLMALLQILERTPNWGYFHFCCFCKLLLLKFLQLELVLLQLLQLLIRLLLSCHQQSLGSAPLLNGASPTEMAMLALLSIRAALWLVKPGTWATCVGAMKQRTLRWELLAHKRKRPWQGRQVYLGGRLLQLNRIDFVCLRGHN